MRINIYINTIKQMESKQKSLSSMKYYNGYSTFDISMFYMYPVFLKYIKII